MPSSEIAEWVAYFRIKNREEEKRVKERELKRRSDKGVQDIKSKARK